MKATILMLMVFASSTFANPAASQVAKVNLDINNANVTAVLDAIEKQTDYLFVYDKNEVDLSFNVTLQAQDISVAEVLNTSFNATGVVYAMEGSSIMLMKARTKNAVNNNAALQQDTKTVSGTVVDARGMPIPGASIVVKGTTTGTISDMDGKFSLSGVPEDATLQFSFVGMNTVEVMAAGQNSFNIVLQDETLGLDEVVVVGYGVQKKSSLTGALQVIKSEKLTDVTTPNVENMLSGKAPGVYVNSGSGRPGDVGAIVIRGKSTVNGSTDPLWVIDGVIVGSSAGALNPSDIESMSILKDAASTAIYGSQGANGVILITTKKGKAGRNVINLSAKLGVTKLAKGNLEVMNGAELYDYYRSFGNQTEIAFDRWNEDLRNSDHDWWDKASQLGFAQDYSASISGGTENMKTYFSVGLYDEYGAVKGYDYTRYNFRFKIDYNPTDWITLKPQVSGSKKDIHDQQHSVSAMYSNLPWDSPYKEVNGEQVLVGNQPNPTWVNTTGSNYLYDLQWNFTDYTTYEAMVNFDFDLDFTDWLSFSSVNNFKYQSYFFNSYSDPRSSSALSVNGRIENYQSNTNRIYTNQLLRFNKSLDKHSINALLAYEWNEYNFQNTNGIATGFAPGFIVSDVAAVPEKVGSSRNQWAVQSYIFNASYDYDSRYLGQFSFRRDGASNFGDNAKYGSFFSISGGWNINREEFFTADWVDQFKLRASYGSVGNRPSALYPQYALYSLSGKYNEMPGALISQAKNDDLTWEKTYTTGIGVDLRFLNRLYLTMDFYDKNTSGLLYNVPLPGIIGITGIWKNVGSVGNQGFEVSAGYDIFNTEDLFWTVEANIGLNRNKVDELYGGKSEIIVGDGSGIAGSASKLLKPGKDVDTWYLTEWAGVNSENGAPEWYTTNEQGERVKTSSYGEASKHQVEMGQYTPDFFGGFSTSVRYKDFDAQANFGYSVGGDIYNYARAEYDSDGAYTDRNQMKLMDGWSRWEKPGDVATHPLPLYNNNTNSNKASSRYLEDGSYLKLRNVTLGYTFDIKHWYVDNIRLTASGENLFTITDYSGVDPEIPPRDGKITGVTTAVYPSTRKFMFGINVTF